MDMKRRSYKHGSMPMVHTTLGDMAEFSLAMAEYLSSREYGPSIDILLKYTRAVCLDKIPCVLECTEIVNMQFVVWSKCAISFHAS